jgi:hypothetical protein
MPSDQEIEAAAEALWLDANQRFPKPAGGWQTLDRRVKDIWRTGARAALQAAERVRAASEQYTNLSGQV